MAIALESAVMLFEALAVRAPGRVVPVDLELLAALAVDQPKLAGKQRLDLRRAEDLDDCDVEIGGAQDIQRLLVGCRSDEKIRDEDRFPGPAHARQMAAERGREVGCAAGRQGRGEI